MSTSKPTLKPRKKNNESDKAEKVSAKTKDVPAKRSRKDAAVEPGQGKEVKKSKRSEPKDQEEHPERPLDTPKETQASGGNQKSRAENRREQKELAKERRAARPFAEVVTQLRPLWEVIRQKTTPVAQKAEPIAKCIELVQGHVVELAQKSDASRVLQTLIQYGNLEQRKIIADDIKIVSRMAADDRAVHVLKKLVLVCSETRDLIISKIRGHIFPLLKSRTACSFLDELYHRLNSTGKMKLLAELYSAEFAALDLPAKVLGVRELLEIYPAKKQVVLENLRKLVPQLLNKQTLDFSVVQRLVNDYLLVEVASKLVGNTEEYLEHLEALLQHPIGCQALVRIIAASAAKERKTIIKTLKPHINRLTDEAHCLPVLLSILAFTDDTVLVGKALVQEIANRIEINIQDKIGSRAVLMLLAGPLDKYITPMNGNLLRESASLAASTSKKDPAVRQKELQEYLLPAIQGLLDCKLEEMLIHPEAFLAIVEYMKVIDQESARALINNIFKVSDNLATLKNRPELDLLLRALIKGEERLASLVYDEMAKSLCEHLDTPAGFLFLVMLRYEKLFHQLLASLPEIQKIESEAAKALATKLLNGYQDPTEKTK